MRLHALIAISITLLGALTGCASQGADHLASWRGGPTRERIESFIASSRALATDAPHLPDHERIAVFDHDGLLIAEQPIYLQYAFVIDRVAERAPDHPEWSSDPLLAAALARDYDAILATRGALARLTTAAGLDGLPVEEYRRIAHTWILGAQHPTLNRRWRECVYQPILELLRHLEAQRFTCFIVTGAGADFVRAIAPVLYGLPAHQVIGDPDPVRVEMRNGAPTAVRLPLDGAPPFPGKPFLIHRHIGAPPAIAFGAGDGDIPMLEYTDSNDGPRLVVLLHHTDATREFAYDRASHIGRNDRALDLAAERNWLVIDMQRDWENVFPAAP